MLVRLHQTPSFCSLFTLRSCRHKLHRHLTDMHNQLTLSPTPTVIAGFLTGGSLAIRGGARAARNSAIGCGVLLAVIEGVGIGFSRLMAENTKLQAPLPPPPPSSGQGVVEGPRAVA